MRIKKLIPLALLALALPGIASACPDTVKKGAYSTGKKCPRSDCAQKMGTNKLPCQFSWFCVAKGKPTFGCKNGLHSDGFDIVNSARGSTCVKTQVCVWRWSKGAQDKEELETAQVGKKISLLGRRAKVVSVSDNAITATFKGETYELVWDENNLTVILGNGEQQQFPLEKGIKESNQRPGKFGDGPTRNSLEFADPTILFAPNPPGESFEGMDNDRVGTFGDVQP